MLFRSTPFDTINTALNGKAASNHSHTAAQVGAAASNHGHNAATASAAGFMAAADKSKLDGIAAKATANAASTTVPKALGTASVGSESGFARGDHVHPKPSLADLGAAASSHNHNASAINAGILPIARGGLGNNSGYVRSGQKAGTTIGNYATAEGNNTVSSNWATHAEGVGCQATGHSSHAEGNNTKAEGDCSHAEGAGCQAANQKCHAEGEDSVASGHTTHAEGFHTSASGMYGAHSEGYYTAASGSYSHAEGMHTVSNTAASHAGGKYNKEMTTSDAFVIGNGSAGGRSNAFRVTFAGQTYGLSAFNTSGADYAEYFEWLDANPENEDRVGFFVTLQGDKINKANAGDYLLGIVSGNPCIIGNADEDWLGRYEHDEFGRFKTIEVETPVTEMRTKEVPVLDENGEPTGEVTVETEEVPTGEVIHGWDYQQNPDYDNTQQYIERKDRPEWAAIGMLGVLAVRDDGTCQVNGFCQCAEGGIATAAAKYIPGQTYRVLARVTENIVKVVFR